MEMTTQRFKQNVKGALKDDALQAALAKLMGEGFPARRRAAIDRLPEFDVLRRAAQAIKNHTLDHLDTYLEQFEAKVIAAGGQVHWAETGEDACRIIEDICTKANAKIVTKGKSMVSEEIGLNDYLDARGHHAVETDLGEYIIQLRHEPPSHIIAPAIHLSLQQVADTFRDKHTHLDAGRALEQPREVLEEARGILRHDFINADVGITGANFLIAETGTAVIVTNEGNGDLTQAMPPVHIAVASIEKMVPTLDDASAVLRVLARSATGQDMTVYNTFFTGPKRDGDIDGPEQFHIVLVDGPRTGLLDDMRDMMRCIKCGACLNHCPVYGAIGGHAYGSVYTGPMGSVLTPAFLGVDCSSDLPGASTFCGRCEAVCPMEIPLPKYLRTWRKRAFDAGTGSRPMRWGLGAWAWLAKRPKMYRKLIGLKMGVLKKLSRHGRIKSFGVPHPWTRVRDFPAPEGQTFLKTHGGYDSATREKGDRP